MDYCSKETFGRGIALAVMGMNAGVVVSLSLVVEYTKELNPKIQFAIFGGIMVLQAVATLIMVVEPPDLKQKKEEEQLADMKTAGP